MLHSSHHLLHPLKLLWRERIDLFWPIWLFTTVIGAVAVAAVVPRGEKVSQNEIEAPPSKWSRGDVLALVLLILFLACYVAGIFTWAAPTYYDNSHYTNGTLLGHNIPIQILPEAGRFWPLGHQEFNLLRHITQTVVGYQLFRVLQLVLLCGILLVLDGALSIKERLALVMLALITPGILISFSGLIYAEANLLFWLAGLAWCVKRFDQTRSIRWAVAAVVAAQFLLYYKETAFILLMGFAAGRLFLRGWRADGVAWNFNRLRDPESRLDICLILLVVLFLFFYLAAMYPKFGMGYANEFRLSLRDVVVSYFKLDFLVWAFAAVVVIRFLQILRGQTAPELLWDGLALGGIGCFAAYLVLRMYSAYYLAPVDLIAVLYLGHLALPSIKSMVLVTRFGLLALLFLVVLQDVSLSAFRMYERKNVIHAKAEMGQAIEARYESSPQNVKRLFFPFANPYIVMEFASYLNYLGVPVEQRPAGSVATGGVKLVGAAIQKDGPCSYRTFVCHPGNTPEPGDLIVVLPDDSSRPEELVPFQQEDVQRIFVYHPQPTIPKWFYPYVSCLHVVSPIFSGTHLPGFWLNGLVAVWP